MTHLPRRDVLRLGGMAGLGLSMPQLLQSQAHAESPVDGTSSFGVCRRVIMLFLHGGHPQQETFDPKPNGPSAVRGEFQAISTSLPGVQFSEVLPRVSSIAHRLAIVRSMTHENPNHVQACLPAQTGHKHPRAFRSRGDFPPSVTDFPPIGAVMNAIRPTDVIKVLGVLIDSKLSWEEHNAAAAHVAGPPSRGADAQTRVFDIP